MFENYEIDLKMMAAWVLAISGLAAGVYIYVQPSDIIQEDLMIQVSDQSPVTGQDIEIEVLENDSLVEASIFRINGENYGEVSSFTYTVPENLEEITIEAEYQGRSAQEVIEVDDSESPDLSNEEGDAGDRNRDQASDDPDNVSDGGSVQDPGNESLGEGSTDQVSEDEAGDSQEEVSDDARSYSIDLSSPEDGQLFETGDQASVEFGFKMPESSSFRLRIDNQLSQSGEGSGEISLTEELSPGEYEWFVRGIKDQQVFDSEIRSFEVIEQASININSNQSDVNGYILDLSFKVENVESYRILVNSETVDEASTGLRDFYSHKFESAGDHIIEVQALRSDKVVASSTKTFSSEAPPTAQINWIAPTSTVDTTTPETEFEVDTDVEYDLVYTINEDESATDYSYWEASGSGSESFSFTPDPLPQGEHDYSITVRDERDTVIGEASGTFETTAERDFLEVNDKEYLHDPEEDIHLIILDLKAYEDLSYDVSINGSLVAEESISGTNVQTSVDMGDLQSGQDYVAEILFESDESSQNLTENLFFTAQ